MAKKSRSNLPPKQRAEERLRRRKIRTPDEEPPPEFTGRRGGDSPEPDAPPPKRSHAAKAVSTYQKMAADLQLLRHEKFSAKRYAPSRIKTQESLTGAEKRHLTRTWNRVQEVFQGAPHIIPVADKTKLRKAQRFGKVLEDARFGVAVIPKTSPTGRPELQVSKDGKVRLIERTTTYIDYRDEQGKKKRRKRTGKVVSESVDFDPLELAEMDEIGADDPSNWEGYVSDLGVDDEADYYIIQGGQLSRDAFKGKDLADRIRFLFARYDNRKDEKDRPANWLLGIRRVVTQGPRPSHVIQSGLKRYRDAVIQERKEMFKLMEAENDREHAKRKKRKQRKRKR